MANFTKKAIKESFVKLLNEKPLSKISVKDIVEECGINRNSFYYHFQDIPALLEEIITEQAEELINNYPEIDSLEKGMEVATDFAIKNKMAVYHIYNSVNRDMYEQYTMRLCRHVVTRYLEVAFKDADVSQDDKDVAVRLISSSLFGLIYDWLNSGMNEERPADIKRVCELCKGIPELIIERSHNN
ncbi:MAG: TetR/AcrR family transcriptional regulator [Lachnospiraceae bacterium]|nr:TetR/AcrR family transcriptional regulator [Lachnospiraceae bacterium]